MTESDAQTLASAPLAHPKQWPIAVHVICEQGAPRADDSPEATKNINLFADTLCLHLSSGERSAGVPVHLWSGVRRDGSINLPSMVKLERARRNLVIVLVDQRLFESRSLWEGYFKELGEKITRDEDLILPVSIHTDAARVAKEFQDVNHIVSEHPANWAEDDRVFQWIYTSVLRLLWGELPNIFLCHTKSGGEEVAKNIRQYIYEHTQLSCFFDRHDIPHGYLVKNSIEAAIEKSLILTIWTEKLLDSPWCQFEIIEARRRQRPMLIVDALTTTSPRMFPFLGNMPVVRWNGNPTAIVSLMLLELIRVRHLEKVFEAYRGDTPDLTEFGCRPPDLLDDNLKAAKHGIFGLRSVSEPQPHALFVYPDPPIKSEELAVLYQSFPATMFLSLNEWRALRAADSLNRPWDPATSTRPEPLKQMNVGISISASDTWADIGLIARHQEDISFNIALQLVLLGAKVSWGGDLRPEGFGSQLRRIVQAYQDPNRPPQDHVSITIPYSLEKGLNLKEIAARRAFAEVHVMEPPFPPDVSANFPQDAASSEGRALRAFALSVMRTKLASRCDARIVLGGGMCQFQGLYPGIAEEAYETVRVGRPLYILGGFGGAAMAVYDAISGRSRGMEDLLQASSKAGAAAEEDTREAHARCVSLAGKQELAFDPQKMVNVFSRLGSDGLAECNGLTPNENERLAASQDMPEIIGLVVRGLYAKWKLQRPEKKG